MKRFLVFSGECYYASGGAADFSADFDEEAAAMKYADERVMDDGWWQVVDGATMRILSQGLCRKSKKRAS
jgi:hypothetical protein